MELNKRITILTGHFGSGKTEIAINLALNEKKLHNKIAINDLDIINPYFRTRDVSILFEQQGTTANRLATSDLPIVSGEIYRVLHDHRYLKGKPWFPLEYSKNKKSLGFNYPSLLI